MIAGSRLNFFQSLSDAIDAQISDVKVKSASGLAAPSQYKSARLNGVIINPSAYSFT